MLSGANDGEHDISNMNIASNSGILSNCEEENDHSYSPATNLLPPPVLKEVTEIEDEIEE
jgi:hypothetical protein